MKASELDLRRILSFTPKGGTIQFMGHRALIIDTIAMGLMRKELIDHLGTFAARNILTRMGYAHGWSTADNLDKEYEGLLKDINCGPTLHELQGVVNKAKSEWFFRPTFYMETTWQDSYEVEQHLLHIGHAHEPICWTLTGYVSGYCSRMLGEEIYCIETHCCAKGDPFCQSETRTREGWGDLIEPHLPFFQAETIDTILHEVTTKLAESETKIKNQSLFEEVGHPNCGLIAKSKVMQQTINLAERIAQVDSSVIVSGESGVGKERIARLIHSESVRALRPFIAINCSAVTETLLESEFYGHTKGAFTGANRDRIGLFEAANGGTLFLDEIGELSATMQVKLLRVLQEKEIRRVGENLSRAVDVRIIAATNRNLLEEVRKGNFREDLYYRLNIFEIIVPALRDRTEDILPLARCFLDRTPQKTDKKVIGFTPEVSECLSSYSWPGNVRQLENTLEHAVVLCQTKRITLQDLPTTFNSSTIVTPSGETIRSIAELEREAIINALKILDGNKAEAAKKLGISLSSLYQKLKQYQS